MIIGSIGELNCYAEIVCAFSLLLGCPMEELNSVLEIIISLSTVTRSEWKSVQLTTNSPIKNHTIDELGPMCYHQTRFSSQELKKLYSLFFGEYNSPSYKIKKVKFTFEETLIIALDYMENGTKYITMSMTYGGDWSRYSMMTNYLP